MRGRGERGQVSADYVGVLLLVAVIIGALLVSGVAGKITGGVGTAICRIAGGDCGGLGGGPTSPADRAAELERRELALAPFAAGGGNYAALLARAAAARQRGDLDEADRILDQLELYSGLTDHDRGDLVDAVAGPSDADFAALVDRGTIDEPDGRNRRYFNVEPSPGDGLIVQDFFIPSATSGGFLDGDDRDTVDPLLGDAKLGDSRIIIVIDRETGRGVITQSHTCVAGYLPDYCEDARPIALRDPQVSPQVDLPGHPASNEFRVDGGDGSLEIEYDALNSITPGGLSVDGTVRFERGPDGSYEKVSDSRDPYPRIVTGQYRPGEPPRIVDETDDEPVLPGALPGPARTVVEGTGKVIDVACDIPWWVPAGPFSPIAPGGPVGRAVLC